MTLIVGLGNVGAKYRGTRHNLGFDVVDELARRREIAFESCPFAAVIADSRRAAWVGETALSTGGDRVLLVKPLTFVNASGEAVAALARYFRIEPGELLVIADDVNLPIGRLRARAQGSSGGHNGLKSIIEYLGEEFARLRLGVGRGVPDRDLRNHVLGRFERADEEDVARMRGRAADAAELFVAEGIGAVMNRYNAEEPAEGRLI